MRVRTPLAVVLGEVAACDRRAWSRVGSRVFVFLVATLFIVVGRLPSIVAPPWDIDEGLYATAGQAITRGELLYRDLWDNKPPAIYFLFSWISRLNPDYTAFRLVGTCFLIATAGVIYLLALKTSSSTRAKASLAIFSFLAAVPIFETHISNAEIFFLLPTSLAIFLTACIEWGGWSGRYYGLVGLALACGLLFKAVVIFDALAIVSLLGFRYGWRIKLPLVQMALGAAAVMLVPALYLIANGLMLDFLRAALLNNVGYVGQGNSTSISLWGISYPWLAILGKLLILASAIVLLRRAHRRDVGPVTLYSLWLIWTMFGALLSGRPYLHYLIATMGAVALLAPEVWQKVWPPGRWRGLGVRSWAKAIALTLALVVILVLGFGGMVQFVSGTPETTRVASGYYANTQRYLSGKMSWEEYLNFFGEAVALNYTVSDYVRANTTPGDRIFVWGNAPWIYYFSQRQHSTRYLVAYQLMFVKGARQEILDELTVNPPALIVMTNEPEMFANAGAPTPPFPELHEFVRDNYQLTTRIGRVEIYQRKASSQHLGAAWNQP